MSCFMNKVFLFFNRNLTINLLCLCLSVMILIICLLCLTTLNPLSKILLQYSLFLRQLILHSLLIQLHIRLCQNMFHHLIVLLPTLFFSLESPLEVTKYQLDFKLMFVLRYKPVGVTWSLSLQLTVFVCLL